MLLVDGDAEDTLLGEGVDGIGQPGNALEDALGDDGLHHIELQLSVLGSNGYGSIVADHLEAGLVDHLRDDRINLARHDRRTRSHGGQVDLVQTATRTGSHEA